MLKSVKNTSHELIRDSRIEEGSSPKPKTAQPSSKRFFNRFATMVRLTGNRALLLGGAMPLVRSSFRTDVNLIDFDEVGGTEGEWKPMAHMKDGKGETRVVYISIHKQHICHSSIHLRSHGLHRPGNWKGVCVHIRRHGHRQHLILGD